MSDPTQRWTKWTEGAQQDVERLGEEALRETPQYPRTAKELTPEEQYRDYVTTLNAPDGPKLLE